MVYILHGYDINNNNEDHTADFKTVLFRRGYSNGKEINEVLKKTGSIFLRRRKTITVQNRHYEYKMRCLSSKKIVKALEVTELRRRLQKSFSTEIGNISYKNKNSRYILT